jgi:hypothetical protein
MPSRAARLRQRHDQRARLQARARWRRAQGEGDVADAEAHGEPAGDGPPDDAPGAG